MKVVTAPTGDARFLREAHLAATVNSAYVVPVHDFHKLPDGRGMLVMELVDGKSLAEVIDTEGALPTAELSRCMTDAAKGMTAHSLEVGAGVQTCAAANAVESLVQQRILSHL